MSESADKSAVEKIMAVFRRTNSDGSYYYSSEDVEHWIPMMLIVLGDPASSWTETNRRIFDDFLKKAKITDVRNPRAAFAKVMAYYEANPINAELEQELAAVALDFKLDNAEARQRRSKAFASQVAGVRSLPSGLSKPPSSPGVRLRKR